MTLERGERERLPGRRNTPGIRTTIGGADGLAVYLRTGLYPDGRAGEIFVTVGKRGHQQIDAGASMDAFAIAVSIGLQYGVPLEVFVDRFVGTRSEPNGPVVGHDAIAFANSIHDYLFRELGLTYLGRDDLRSGGAG